MRIIQLSTLALSFGLVAAAHAWGPGWGGPPPGWGAPPAWNNAPPAYRGYSPYWNNRPVQRKLEAPGKPPNAKQDKDTGGSCATVDDNRKYGANRDRRPPWARGNWPPSRPLPPRGWNHPSMPDRPAWPGNARNWTPPTPPAPPQWGQPRW
jgi:hypothetical protein